METTLNSQTGGAERLPSKMAVKEWMKATGKNRDWLANKCGVSKRTVDCWFAASGNIPARAILVLQGLMADFDKDAVDDHSLISFGIDLSRAPQRFVVLVLQVAQRLNTTPEKAVICIFEAAMRSTDFTAFVDERKEGVCHA